MQTLVLERPPTPRNAPKVARPEAECNPPSDDSATQADPSPKTAREILADSDWAVLISRAMVLEFCNPQDFPAFLVYAAARALWDRGLRGRAPGGWPELLGMSRRSWYSARRRAIALGLISASPGSSRIVPLAKLEPHQQFAKAPAEILFDQTLTRTARRVFIVLSLYRSGFGDSRVAVRTLADGSSTHSRNVHKALRELQKRYHITNMGSVGRGAVRYFLKGQKTPRASKSSTQDAPKNPVSYPQAHTLPKGEPSDESHPYRGGSRNESHTDPATRATLTVGSNLDSLKRRAPTALADGPSPRDEKPPPTKTQAQAILRRFSMKSPGSDFGKDCLQEGQQERRVADPPATWTAKDFKSAIQSAEASLGDATATEQRTLRAQIADFSDQIERISP